MPGYAYSGISSSGSGVIVLPSDLSTNVPSMVDDTGSTEFVGYGFNIGKTATTGGGLMLSSFTPASLIYVARSGAGGYLNWISLASGATPTPTRLSSFEAQETDAVCAESDIYGTIYDPTTEFVIVGDNAGSTDPNGCTSADSFSLVTSPASQAASTATLLPTTIDWTQPVVPLYNASGQLTGVFAFPMDTTLGGDDLAFYPSSPVGTPPSFSATAALVTQASAAGLAYLRIDTNREGVVNSGGSVIFFELSTTAGYQLWRIDGTLKPTLIHTFAGDPVPAAGAPPVRDDTNIYFGDQTASSAGMLQTTWYSAPIAGGSATLLSTTAPYSSTSESWTLVDSDGSYLIATYSNSVTSAASLQSMPISGAGGFTAMFASTDGNTAGIQAYLDYASKHIFINHQTLNLAEPYTAPDSLVMQAPLTTKMNATPASRYLAVGSTLLTTEPAILQLTGLIAAPYPPSDQGAAVVSVNMSTLQSTAITVAGGTSPFTLPACAIDTWATPTASGFYAAYLTPQGSCDSGNEIGILIDTTRNQGVMTPLTDSLYLY